MLKVSRFRRVSIHTIRRAYTKHYVTPHDEAPDYAQRALVRQPAVFGIIVCLYLCGSELWSRCEDISLLCVYADIVIFKDINKSVGQ